MDNTNKKRSLDIASATIGFTGIAAICITQMIFTGYHHFHMATKLDQMMSENNFILSDSLKGSLSADEAIKELNHGRERLMQAHLDNDAPEFIDGVDEATTLTSAQIKQFRNSTLYQKFGMSDIIQAKIKLAKEDGKLTVGEYYEIRQIMSDLSFIETEKHKVEAERMDEANVKAELDKL